MWRDVVEPIFTDGVVSCLYLTQRIDKNPNSVISKGYIIAIGMNALYKI